MRPGEEGFDELLIILMSDDVLQLILGLVLTLGLWLLSLGLSDRVFQVCS
jgi:hypothetical protein